MKEERMKEEQILTNNFLEKLKKSLFENCNYRADSVILENNISDCIKLVRKALNEQFTITINDSQEETNKSKVIKYFENRLIINIEEIIGNIVYLKSRIDAKKDVPNTLDIKKLVEEFSNVYFV